MIQWLDLFLQLFIQAMAWCTAIAATLVNGLIAFKLWTAVADWRWNRRKARLARRVGAL